MGPLLINSLVLTCYHLATVALYKMHLTATFKSHRHEHSIKYAYLKCPRLIPKWTVEDLWHHWPSLLCCFLKRTCHRLHAKCFKNLKRWWRNYPEETKTHQFCHNKTFLFLPSSLFFPVDRFYPEHSLPAIWTCFYMKTTGHSKVWSLLRIYRNPGKIR